MSVSPLVQSIFVSIDDDVRNQSGVGTTMKFKFLGVVAEKSVPQRISPTTVKQCKGFISIQPSEILNDIMFIFHFDDRNALQRWAERGYGSSECYGYLNNVFYMMSAHSHPDHPLRKLYVETGQDTDHQIWTIVKRVKDKQLIEILKQGLNDVIKPL